MNTINRFIIGLKIAFSGKFYENFKKATIEEECKPMFEERWNTFINLVTNNPEARERIPVPQAFTEKIVSEVILYDGRDEFGNALSLSKPDEELDILEEKYDLQKIRLETIADIQHLDAARHSAVFSLAKFLFEMDFIKTETEAVNEEYLRERFKDVNGKVNAVRVRYIFNYLTNNE